MDYRKFYREVVCAIPTGFDIHHLDEDKKNNKIPNLLMLPSELHQQYHDAKTRLNYLFSNAPTSEITSILDRGNNWNSIFLDSLKEFEEIRKECSKWADYKLFCLNKIPNLHQINLKDYQNG